MAVVGHGIDLVECARIARILAEHPDRFAQRVLTGAEQSLMKRHKNPVPFVAGRWAAKEAILKMLGTGWRGKIAWTDMDIQPDVLGRPVVTLRGETERIAQARGVRQIHLSITHTQEHAAASALGVNDAM